MRLGRLPCSRNARPVGKRGVSAPRGWAGENGKQALVGRAQSKATPAPSHGGWLRQGLDCEVGGLFQQPEGGSMSAIRDIKGRQILDSRGNPTIEEE
jgi:hypothetical protein